MKKILNWLSAFIVIVILSGCTGVPVNFADRSITDRSQIDVSQGKRISASASGFQLMLFIPIGVNSRQRNAYEELLEKAGDSVLSDITITESWSYAFVGTVYKTTIEATAYPKPKTTNK